MSEEERAVEVARGLSDDDLKWMQEAAQYLRTPDGAMRKEPHTISWRMSEAERRSLEKLKLVQPGTLYLTDLGTAVAAALSDPRP